MQRIAIIGGGIAGLTVARRRAVAGDQVVLFEAADRVGGQLSSERRNGLVVEHGAEGFLARSEVVPPLAAEAGIADDIVEQLEHTSFRYHDARLLELAPGEAARLLGFQVSSDELGRGIRSFRLGMAELPERLAKTLGDRVDIRLNSPVQSVAPSQHGVTLTGHDAQRHSFDSVVIATTARSVAALLGEALGSPAQALQDSVRLSSLTVSLAFRRESIPHPLAGTGFIVPEPEQLGGVRAVTFTSSKLPHRAPTDQALVRVFFRPSERDLRELSDSAWAERAERGLTQALGVSARHEQAFVSRWPDALPVFDDLHRARVSALESALDGQRTWLAGAAFHGAGIDAAIRSAEQTAERIASRS